MNNNTITSGQHKLKKLTKAGVTRLVRDTGWFHGYICGNKVDPKHLSDKRGLSMRVDTNSLVDLQVIIDEFEVELRVFTPELGSGLHYYHIVDYT